MLATRTLHLKRSRQRQRPEMKSPILRSLAMLLQHAPSGVVGLRVCESHVGGASQANEGLGISSLGAVEFEFVVREMDRFVRVVSRKGAKRTQRLQEKPLRLCVKLLSDN